LPDVGDIDGVISLGGPMSANDLAEHAWLGEEIKLLRRVFDANLPIAGICLGGQLLACALGGRVERNGRLELGWFPISLTESGKEDPVLKAAGLFPLVYQWHEDTFHLPPGAELLASSEACPRQAYRMNEQTYGFQFHPETDHQLLGEWLDYQGVAEEIKEHHRREGGKFIQNARTQLARAEQGERSGLRITAAIGALFRRRTLDEASEGFAQSIEDWVSSRDWIKLLYVNPQGEKSALEGKLMAHVSIADGCFVILKTPPGLQWPVRVEDILEIRPSEK
jgi:GMP synthase (glutamine-hydrolysing)